jgi:hypothetical protein
VSAGATPRIRLVAKHNSRSREAGKPKTITIVNENTTGLSIGPRDSIPRAVLTGDRLRDDSFFATTPPTSTNLGTAKYHGRRLIMVMIIFFI